MTLSGTVAQPLFVNWRTGQPQALQDLGLLPYFDVVRDYSADNTGNTDATPAFNNAKTDALKTAGPGGIIFVPPGNFLLQNFSLVPGVSMIGSGVGCTILQAWHVDVPVLTLTGASGTPGFIRDFGLYGKGFNNDTGTFGASATSSPLVMPGSDWSVTDIFIRGGYYNMDISGIDNKFTRVVCDGFNYGPAVVHDAGANWYIRNKWDTDPPPGFAITSSFPYSAWAAATMYSLGNVAKFASGSYYMICTKAGTSGGTEPGLVNYGLTSFDNTVQWMLLAPAGQSAYLTDGPSGEDHLYQCDFSGIYDNSVTTNSSGTIAVITDCVCGKSMVFTNNQLVIMSGCEIAQAITVTVGKCHIENNKVTSVSVAINVNVAANASDFAINNNHLGGGTVTIAAGTSDHYTVLGNIRCTVTDHAGGAHSAVANNVA